MEAGREEGGRGGILHPLSGVLGEGGNREVQKTRFGSGEGGGRLVLEQASELIPMHAA